MLTKATMHQHPHKLVIDTKRKTTALKDNWEERPMIPIQVSISNSNANPAGYIRLTNKGTQSDALHATLWKLRETRMWQCNALTWAGALTPYSSDNM